jgi:ribulose-5-phosphate 4-epimerase/fuculose-1-phosphate aldolase
VEEAHRLRSKLVSEFLPEAQARGELTDAIRMLERANVVDYNGHFSARVGENRVLINSGPSVRGALQESDIIAIDMDGKPLDGNIPPPLEFHLHTEIYRARPDVMSVVHTHPRWSTYLSMTGTKYQPVFAQGVLLGDIPLFDSPNSINTKPMGEALAKAMGQGPSILLKSHGVTVVGSDVVEAFTLAVYLEENSERQYMAMQIGKPYVFSKEEQDLCRQKLWTRSLFKKTWDHYRSKL